MIDPRSAYELAADYDAVLLDAYGVLNDSAEALPGAAEMLDRFRAEGVSHYVVTNDASRLPETIAARFERLGLGPVAPGRIITSGSLLERYFADHELGGARCVVLGPDDSASYVRDAGGEVVRVGDDTRVDVVAVCDDGGYPFLPTLEATLSLLFEHFDQGDEVRLVLPNPDLIYPRPAGAFGFTSGAAALLLEAGLARRYPTRELRFERLGKPFTPMYEEAMRRAGSSRLLMVGDQLETDIAGARAAGLDAALLRTGVTNWDETDGAVAPTYVIDRLV